MPHDPAPAPQLPFHCHWHGAGLLAVCPATLVFLLQGPAHRERTEAATEIIWWTGVALVVALVLIGLGVVIYRRVTREDGDPTGGSGFTLAELRRLRAEGQLSDEEFEQAKKLIIATNPMMAAVLRDEEPPDDQTDGEDDRPDADEPPADGDGPRDSHNS